jgi:hypothetical protein
MIERNRKNWIMGLADIGFEPAQRVTADVEAGPLRQKFCGRTE